jgi:hypothetical protein
MTAVSQKPYDLFIVSYERAGDREVMKKVINAAGTSTTSTTIKTKGSPIDTGPWEIVAPGSNTEPIGGTRNTTMKMLLRQTFWWKLGAAIAGAAFLVGPTWLLVLKRDLYLHLGATTGFVFGFGILLTFFVEKIDQVFAGTLAYAAVLMVFVGVLMQEVKV